ncbi:putative low temperature requirement a protein [Neofusicoccum parvum]|uniref:Low temperature requirement a protein n=1 Tax=Neofusicoccum parvum TaxID=310453 RepID=A0ACB5SMZ3_9PEZI|nr:putative low temperature requirement a protein [Neofusicoccum parvum]
MVNTPEHKDKHFHRVVPFAENPCEGADYADAVFSQRHEANPDELCFDLFFVANLATFTAYHTIDDYTSLGAYVGFFAILWATWFQITLHDVRFARDTVYERACKVVQFVVFVGLALAGSKFEPSGSAKSNMNFRTLCYVLVLSRCLLALQYVFVLVAVARKHFSKLYLPIGLNIAIYAVAAAAFGGMTPAFEDDSGARPDIYWLWWVILFLEGVGTVTISCFWRMLSFKKTHLVERMGLLTLIVIGEGAIGVTKTVSKMMGKYGLDVEGTLLVLCIVFVLVFLFLTYFDNTPHGHYGTIRQQIWALLHFPFQLAVVGAVEGSQQIALARYVMNGMNKFQHKIIEYCVDDELEGSKLVDKLTTAVKYYQLDTKPECYRELLHITEALKNIGNLTGICTKTYTETFPSDEWAYEYPKEFAELVSEVWSGVTMSVGMKVAMDEEPNVVMLNSWRVVYIYFWASLFVIFACIIAFLTLIRTRGSKPDLFDFCSIGGRILMLSLCLFFGCLAASDVYFQFLSSGMVLPTGMLMLGVTLGADHLARVFCNWRLRRQGYEPPVEVLHDHHHHNRHSKIAHADPELDRVDELLQKQRVRVRESKAFGFKDQSPPRPISAVYLMSNFAASLSSVQSEDKSSAKSTPVPSPRLPEEVKEGTSM